MPRSHPRSTVELGYRYLQVGGSGGMWAVIGFATDHAGNPHAQLASERDPTRVITIAFAALLDRRLYARSTPDTSPTEGSDDIRSEPIAFARGGPPKLA